MVGPPGGRERRADESSVLKHRHIEKSPGTGGFDQPNDAGIPFGIGPFSSKVGYVDCFFGGSHTKTAREMHRR
jgi:hypothetical protein